MFSELSGKIAGFLEETGAVKSSERVICQYGIKQGLNILFNLITILIIGLLMNMLWQSLVFTIFYIPLRSYAGGFHAKTPQRCYLFSVCMNIAVLVIIRLFSSVEPVFSTLAAAGSLAVFILAPVGTRNKPLDKTERLVYRQKTIMLLAAELIIYLVLLFFHLKETAAAAAMALLALGFMLVMGSIKLYHEKHTAGKQIR